MSFQEELENSAFSQNKEEGDACVEALRLKLIEVSKRGWFDYKFDVKSKIAPSVAKQLTEWEIPHKTLGFSRKHGYYYYTIFCWWYIPKEKEAPLGFLQER